MSESLGLRKHQNNSVCRRSRTSNDGSPLKDHLITRIPLPTALPSHLYRKVRSGDVQDQDQIELGHYTTEEEEEKEEIR